MLQKRYFLSILTVLAAWVSYGAEGDAAPPQGEMRRGFGGGRGGMRAQMENINRQLKEKFPAEYAEIEKMRETDRMGAMRKMMELAGKAGLEMPFGRRGMMGHRPDFGHGMQNEWTKFFAELKEKAPAEFAEIEKKLTSDPQNALKELAALAEKHGLKMPTGPLPSQRPQVSLNRNGNRFMIQRANRILEKSRPEDYAKLQELRETDDDAAREFFRKLAKEEGLTPRRLLAEPIRPVQSVSYSDKDIEEQYPSPVTTRQPWGGFGRWGGRGGFHRGR